MGEALKWAYLGLVIGDLISGLVSQWMRSRRWPILGFQIFGVFAVAWLIQTRGLSARAYERGCFFIGLEGMRYSLPSFVPPSSNHTPSSPSSLTR